MASSDWVVYHTGSTATDDGTVKKVELSVLDQHPDPRWRPIEAQQEFFGFLSIENFAMNSSSRVPSV